MDIILPNTRTRAEVIESGALIEMPQGVVDSCGLSFPVALSNSLMEKLHDYVVEDVSRGFESTETIGRAWMDATISLLCSVAVRARALGDDSTTSDKTNFSIQWGDETVAVEIGPDDDNQPCWTVYLDS